MLKLWKKHQKFLKGDAGFSLVELIIVIAIMAALIAILAPQYIKYVEKSRKSADETVADQILTAVKVLASDPEIKLPASNFSVNWAPGGAISCTNTTDLDSTTDGVQDIASYLTSSLGSLTQLRKSTSHNADYFVVSYTATTFAITGTWQDEAGT